MSNACNIYRKAVMSSSFVIKNMDTHENSYHCHMIVKNYIYKCSFCNQDPSPQSRLHYTCTHKHHMYMYCYFKILA